MLDKYAVLKQYFGHSSFREGQEEVTEAILNGKDVLCVMPTGAGKSVCYQVPALVFPGVTLVVSPLISLMKDQVNALTQNGIPAAYLNSSLTAAQYGKVIENLAKGSYKIIYVAPERLTVPGFVNACKKIKVDLLAIDEAHCISQWGQDFRPGYLKIADFVDTLGVRPVIAAFTATATAEVKDDIEYSLRLRNPFRVSTGFDRPNLTFEAFKPKNKWDALLAVLRNHKDDAGIVYCATRKTVEEVTAGLEEAGFSVTKYHAGLDDDVRKKNQEDFVFDRVRVMVATNAFGMGIDKSNVSFVIHYNMPKDIESYYQEAGRAGRDGVDAECVLLYSPGDVQTNQFLIENAEPNPDLDEAQRELLRARNRDRLKQMTFYSTTNTCLRHFILDYFGEKSANYCGNCSNCLTKFEEVDMTREAQMILSCVKRTGERYGKKMICDILRGSQGEKVIRAGLDRQTTYGLLREVAEPQVRSIIDQLEYDGYLKTVGSDYPTLSLTEKAGDVLYRNAKVSVKQAKPKEKSAKAHQTATGSASLDGDLLRELKALRRKLAEQKNVPAYVVFSDATLIDMCKKLPATEEDLLEVSGVGKTKLEWYGEAFLQVLRQYRARDNGSR